MAWRKSAEAVAKFAPALGAALAGPAGAVVGGIVARSFGGVRDDNQLASAIGASASAAQQLQKIQTESAAEIRQAEIAAAVAQSTETNKTLRAMTQSGDPLVKRAPAVFLYILGFTWLVQMGGLTYLAGVIIWRGDDVAADLVGIKEIISAMTPFWGFALSVAGIGIHADRKCKEAENGRGGQGAFSKIMAAAFSGRGETK